MNCKDHEGSKMTTTVHMTDAEAVMLVRNALLIAGQEMGDGDHWPVIKSTVNAIMKDYDELLAEREVHAEMKRSLYEQLEEMERILPTCPQEEQEQVGPLLEKLRGIYDAHFTAIDEDKVVVDEDDVPEHVKRASLIMQELMEGEDD